MSNTKLNKIRTECVSINTTVIKTSVLHFKYLSKNGILRMNTVKHTSQSPKAVSQSYAFILEREERKGRVSPPSRDTEIPIQRHWTSHMLIMPEQQQKEQLHQPPLFSTCMRWKYLI